MSGYRGRPGARHLERSELRQPAGLRARRHVMALPVTADELAEQLRAIVPHHPQCRWSTNAHRRPGQPLAVTEVAACTCTAVPDRQHLAAVVRAAARGELPPVVTSPTGARPPATAVPAPAPAPSQMEIR